jgi:VIT1/CCC1 family predicted Fe2+/Mn2+ transporter
VAGIGEGFVGAGASQAAALLAVLAATIAGSIALAGAKYAEAANERDAELAVLEEEERQLALSPAEELAELTEIYERKGLPPELAAQVAAELSQHNPLAAHAEAEHGIDLRGSRIKPLVVALGAASAFTAGALVVIATIMLSPTSWRSVAVLLATAMSLTVTSAIAGRWGRVPLLRTAVRTVTIGLSALLLSLAVGSLFDL